jgi:hypothetical protein
MTLCCAKFVDKLGECWFSILAQSAMPDSDHDEDDEDDEDVDDKLLGSRPDTQQGKMLLMKTRKDVILFYFYNYLARLAQRPYSLMSKWLVACTYVSPN